MSRMKSNGIFSVFHHDSAGNKEVSPYDFSYIRFSVRERGTFVLHSCTRWVCFDQGSKKIHRGKCVTEHPSLHKEHPAGSWLMAMYCMCMLDFTYMSAHDITVLSETLNIELTHTNSVTEGGNIPLENMCVSVYRALVWKYPNLVLFFHKQLQTYQYGFWENLDVMDV